jgi:hypothetical protein
MRRYRTISVTLEAEERAELGLADTHREIPAARWLFRRWLLRCWGLLPFTVISSARNSNRTAADAPVELILLRFGVRRTVDAVAELSDFYDHYSLLPLS